VEADLPQTILVTGGAGFIGSNFVLQQVESGARVVTLDKLTYAGNAANLASLAGHERHCFVQGGIEDGTLVARLLEEYRPAAIVNFAAETHVDRSIVRAEEFIQTNVVGTFRLLEAALAYWRGLDGEGQKGFRFLQVSTDEVYGTLEADEAAFTEESQYRPNSPYSATKAAGDHLARAYHRTYGLPMLTTNCSNNYGPFQFPEKLIPLMILNALAGRELPVYGDGRQVRDWLYVGDHCRAVGLVLERGRIGETYNIGGEGEMANLEVVRAICGLLDELRPAEESRQKLIRFVKDRPGHDRRYAIDAAKIKQELGWRAEESFASGLRRTVEWYLANERWVQQVSSGEYRQWMAEQYEGRGAAR
jgi:dTDP-glucose 4,6-dehydratase